MGRWTQYDEDPHRLPEGFTRVAYDADTGNYIYRDKEGNTYHGEPGNEYGMIKDRSQNSLHRPVFESDTQPPQRASLNINPPSTFQDILPPNLITSSSVAESSKSQPRSQSSHSRSGSYEGVPKLVRTVRRSAFPKMQGVVQNVLRRSITMARKSHDREPSGSNQQYTILPEGDSSTSSLRKSEGYTASPTNISRGKSLHSQSSSGGTSRSQLSDSSYASPRSRNDDHLYLSSL